MIQTKHNRLISIDVFRGMTIILMLLVNNPGSWAHVYKPLLHAEWHGCTPTDLVFPFFLFIVGISIGLSHRKYSFLPSKLFLIKAIKRGTILILIGYLLSLFPFTDIHIIDGRIMGVLQRIGLAYIIAAFIINLKRKNHIIILGILILIAYWFILYITSHDPYSLETNLVRKIDLVLLGEDRMWHGKGIAFDPEGLLSTFPSAITIIIGYLVSQFIISKENLLLQIKSLLLTGIIMIFLGWIWSFLLPINKSLWTSSYVIFTAGLAMTFLALLMFLIDIKKKIKWTKFFVAYGSNPLFLYVLSGLFTKSILKLHWNGKSIYSSVYNNCFVPILGPLNGSLAFAISHIVLFGIIAIILYRSKVFIKV